VQAPDTFHPGIVQVAAGDPRYPGRHETVQPSPWRECAVQSATSAFSKVRGPQSYEQPVSGGAGADQVWFAWHVDEEADAVPA
jgi:hypothetical protein